MVDLPVQTVFWKDDEVHGGQVPACLANEFDDAFRLRVQLLFGVNDGQLRLADADDDA